MDFIIISFLFVFCLSVFCCLIDIIVKRPLWTLFIVIFPLICVCIWFVSSILWLLVLGVFFLVLLLMGYSEYNESKQNNYKIYIKKLEFLALCRDNITGFYKVCYKNKNRNIKTREVYIKNNGTCDILYDDGYIRSDLNYKVEDNYFIIKFKDGGERVFLISYYKGNWNIRDKKCLLNKINYSESILIKLN